MNRWADIAPQPAGEADTTVRCHLRLLATSDVHGAILPYDYASGRDGTAYGLARTASLISRARREAPGGCLLVDNGDFLQGTPLSDLHDIAGESGRHPVITAMNRLGYDAVTLGNHEFNFGLPALRAALDQATFPVICSNALARRGAQVADDVTLLPPSVMVERELHDRTGARHRLRVGLLGLLPPQIMAWDRFHLARDVCARDIIETAAARVPMLRAEGADLVVLLAHTGLEHGDAGIEAENAALSLARLPGVDAIIAGHSHEVFPDPAAASRADGPDHRAGTFFGVPAVMAGFRGSHLGVIDLDLIPGPRGWRVAGHRVEARAVAPGGARPPAPPDPAIIAAVRRSHAATLAYMRAPLGRTSRPIHSYLSRYRCDLPVLLVAEAQRAAVARALTGGPLDGVPLLSATAPFQTGGRAGPDAFTDIPAGPLSLGNAADLQPFPNTLCALLLSGAELRDWLERSVSCFRTLVPGLPDQPLWDARFPGNVADTVLGVRYEIDLARPPLYDARGVALAGEGVRGRIRSLSHRGVPVRAGDRFVMAVNSYRAFGGGPYPALPEDRLVHASRAMVRDAVAGFLGAGGLDRLDPVPVWTFAPIPGASALIETGPGLRRHPGDIAAMGLTDLGLSEAGFLRLRLPLDGTACETGG